MNCERLIFIFWFFMALKQAIAAAVFFSSVRFFSQTRMHYIHLPLVKTAYQIFLCWSLFHKTFALMSGSHPDQRRILTWEQNRILVVREKGRHIKIFDDTSYKNMTHSPLKKTLMSCHGHWCSQNIDFWLEKCKGRYTPITTWLNCKDWAHHHTGILQSWKSCITAMF